MPQKTIPAGIEEELMQFKGEGWLLGGSIGFSNPFSVLVVDEDEFITTNTPYVLRSWGLIPPNNYVWASRYVPTSALYVVSFILNPPSPFSGYVRILLRTANKNLVTGTPITTPTVMYGGAVFMVTVTDKAVFDGSFRSLLGTEKIQPLKE